MLCIDRFNGYTLSKAVRFSNVKSSKRTAHEKGNLINQYLRLHCICSKIYVIYFVNTWSYRKTCFPIHSDIV